MSKTIGVLVVTLAMGLSVRLAGAQMIDPSTGITVDAATDPMDFSAIMSGQPTNFGLEAALSANAQAQATMNANMEAADANSQSSMDATNTADASDETPPAPPSTPKPVITPGGGTFNGSVQVSIADSDAQAAVFYTTDGKKPTTSSQRYVGPIAVTVKTKVEALAFDVNMRASGVVSKTFEVKVAKGP